LDLSPPLKLIGAYLYLFLVLSFADFYVPFLSLSNPYNVYQINR